MLKITPSFIKKMPFEVNISPCRELMIPNPLSKLDKIDGFYLSKDIEEAKVPQKVKSFLKRLDDAASQYKQKQLAKTGQDTKLTSEATDELDYGACLEKTKLINGETAYKVTYDNRINKKNPFNVISLFDKSGQLIEQIIRTKDSMVASAISLDRMQNKTVVTNADASNAKKVFAWKRSLQGMEIRTQEYQDSMWSSKIKSGKNIFYNPAKKVVTEYDCKNKEMVITTEQNGIKSQVTNKLDKEEIKDLR